MGYLTGGKARDLLESSCENLDGRVLWERLALAHTEVHEMVTEILTEGRLCDSRFQYPI